MGYELKIYENAPIGKIIPFLTNWLGVSERRAKRLVDKGRVRQNGEPIERKGQIVSGKIEALVFMPTIGDAMEPIFDAQDFAIFNKPSGMLSHPNGFNSPPSVLDYAKTLFGDAANITHRLDALTSGLIIVAKNKKAEIEFKNMFQYRGIKKRYLALIRGRLDCEITVNAPLKQEPFGEVRLKMRVREDGKECVTTFKPIEIYENSTFVEVEPLTGRLHQIRAHAEHIGMAILGDPLYGVDSAITKAYLDKTISKEELKLATFGSRLCLHASFLEFSYLGQSATINAYMDFKNITP